jgi:hypothetical protein
MWWRDPGGAIVRQFLVRGGRVVRPQDHRRPLSCGNGVEAMVVAGGCDRREADFVLVERQIDVDRLARFRCAERLGKTEILVKRGGACGRSSLNRMT